MAYYYIFFLLPFQRNNIKSRPKHGQSLLSPVLSRSAGGEILDTGSGNVSCIIVSGVNFSVSGVFSVPGVFLSCPETLRSCPVNFQSCPETLRSCPETLRSCPENTYLLMSGNIFDHVRKASNHVRKHYDPVRQTSNHVRKTFDH